MVGPSQQSPGLWVGVSAVGLKDKELKVVSEAYSWGTPPRNKPLVQKGYLFEGRVWLDPGDMTAIKVQCKNIAETKRIKEARIRAGVHSHADVYFHNTIFLAILGWKKSTKNMPYPYSIAPEPTAAFAAASDDKISN